MARSNKHSVLPATEREAALRRIGFYHYKGNNKQPQVNHHEVLEWFIKLAQRKEPLKTLPEAELELLTHEYRAIQEKMLPYFQNVVTMKELDDLRANARFHLEELLDEKQTRFGPFKITRTVMQAKDSLRDIYPSGVYDVTSLASESGQGLLHLLSVLVSKFPIDRCPQCQSIFALPRADARYCSRQCQANAYAKAQREAVKMKKSVIKKKRGSVVA